jgi:anti-sigma-K factor RskA
MNRCAKNRKLIAWQTLGALKASQAERLRAHLEVCADCRQYLQEMSQIAEKLSALDTHSEVEVSAAFHQRLRGRLSITAPAAARHILPVSVYEILSQWCRALAVTGAAAVLIGAFCVFGWHRSTRPTTAHLQMLATPARNWNPDLEPTIANYQIVAFRSLDDLDELLTRQALKAHSPLPTYAGSAAE